MESELPALCDSYEELQDRLEGKPTGRFSGLLPGPIYRFFFGVRPPDSDAVAERRAAISERFVDVNDRFRSVYDELSEGFDRNPIHQPPDEVLAGFVASPSVPNWVQPPGADDDIDLDAYHESLEQEADRLNSLQHSTQRLFRHSNQAFLLEDEQEELEVINEILTTALDSLKNYQSTVLATANLKRHFEEWEQRVSDLEDRMEQYRSYEIYDVDSGIRQSIDELQSELDEVVQQADESLLTEADREAIDSWTSTLSWCREQLQEYQTAFLQHHFRQTHAESGAIISEIQEELRPARDHGESISNPSELQAQITSAVTSIDDLRSYPLRDHLADSKVETLKSHKETLKSLAEYIEAKTTFDEQIRNVETNVSSLEAAAEPYLDYNQYLTEPDHLRINEHLTKSEEAVASLRDSVHPNSVTAPDQERLADAIDTISAVEKCLDDYNATFIELERERYADLFTDIGPHNLNLTPTQQRAVIRNDIYNQVVAAAGTGKTLVLITRVAYLIRSQNINPEQILVVAFTNEACEEMETRLETYFGITDVNVRTIHSFGYNVLANARDSVETIDPHQITNFVESEIRAARNGENDAFLSHYYEFLVHFDAIYLDEADFEEKSEYIEQRREQDYITLQCEEVKSRAEKRIADFLFTHKIDYRYESKATWAETAQDKDSYDPDFYLPEYDLYIEHWGLDTAGEVAPWFEGGTEGYHAKMRWAREQFEQHDPELVETYNFEYEAGHLDEALESRLQYHGVELDRMDFEELVESAFDYERREGWIKQRFKEFMLNAKRFDVRPDEIVANLTEANPRQYHFAKCGILLLQQYQRYLVEHDLIDFTDQLSQSLEVLQDRPSIYQGKYDHLLVDEFQDIGPGMRALLQELSGVNAAQLFAVGDDWQSIYSFQGAQVESFIDFEKHFGRGTQTRLTENFRSPPTVIDAGNTLIDNNDRQIDKQVQPTVETDTTPLVHTLQGYTFFDYVHRIARHTVELIQEYLQSGSTPDEVMVLCRFDNAVPHLDEIKNELREVGIPYDGKSDSYGGALGTGEGVSVYSVHQSKGREAKHVILVHAAEGPYGFPPADRGNDLLDPVQPIEMNTEAEERRAFYVALTRTEETLDILTRTGQKSRFLKEIDEHTETTEHLDAIEPLGDVGSEMSVVAKVNKLFDDLHPKKHQDGYLVDQYGGSARFVSWSSSDPPTLELNSWYQFHGARVDEFKDTKELVLTSRSSVTPVGSPEKYTSDSVSATED